MTVTLSETQNAAVDAIMAWYKEPKPQEFYLAGLRGILRHDNTDTETV